ncbi:hypothetical protein HGRIS_000557 [Hohenbuehelia grisea]|uniref:Hydrophobin n=1 Tax=Hohenbuehelia grisea TaxID=104357 RepID=A0ABR3JS73_9AGAR
MTERCIPRRTLLIAIPDGVVLDVLSSATSRPGSATRVATTPTTDTGLACTDHLAYHAGPNVFLPHDPPDNGDVPHYLTSLSPTTGNCNTSAVQCCNFVAAPDSNIGTLIFDLGAVPSIGLER